MPRLTKGPLFFSKQPNESKDSADVSLFIGNRKERVAGARDYLKKKRKRKRAALKIQCFGAGALPAVGRLEFRSPARERADHVPQLVN